MEVNLLNTFQFRESKFTSMKVKYFFTSIEGNTHWVFREVDEKYQYVGIKYGRQR